MISMACSNIATMGGNGFLIEVNCRFKWIPRSQLGGFLNVPERERCQGFRCSLRIILQCLRNWWMAVPLSQHACDVSQTAREGKPTDRPNDRHTPTVIESKGDRKRGFGEIEGCGNTALNRWRARDWKREGDWKEDRHWGWREMEWEIYVPHLFSKWCSVVVLTQQRECSLQFHYTPSNPTWVH